MMASSSFSGSSKRARAPGNIIQVAHCSVDGCNADLSLCREYHRRHKVCEIHSKSAKVMIRGHELRFCQQCSRFHSLIEFDEGKRSCRKRLDGHNRRRRKAQQDPVSRTSAFPSQPGVSSTRLLSFSSPLISPNPVMSSLWATLVKPESNMGVYNTQPLSNYAERQNSLQLQFPQEVSVCQHPAFDPNPSSGNATTGRRIFSGGFNQVVDSDRALSLLSSTPCLAQEFSSNEDSLIHNLHYGSLAQYQFIQEMESKPRVSTMDSHDHLPEMFENRAEGMSSSGSRQTLSFMWE